MWQECMACAAAAAAAAAAPPSPRVCGDGGRTTTHEAQLSQKQKFLSHLFQPASLHLSLDLVLVQVVGQGRMQTGG